jgi:hypothetical protein
MRFEVSRTSIWQEEKPCPEARRVKGVRIDLRTADDPSKIPAYEGKSTAWWYGKGRNHRVENGYIQRDFPTKYWVVDFETLEELMAFYKKYCPLILHPSFDDESMPCLEIYDDYRE